VLVVEDSDDSREMLAQLLDLEGFNPITARHGKEALALLSHTSPLPSAIIADLMMPVMDGWELCAQLRADPRLADIPVIVLSAVADRGHAPHAVAVLRKPLNLDALLGALSQCWA
jgi:CheY-like chemotaxis protein